MSKQNRLRWSGFVFDYHTDPELKGHVVSAEFSDDENRRRVAVAAPWAVVIQRENCMYGAYECADQAAREMRRLQANGLMPATNSTPARTLRVRLTR